MVVEAGEVVDGGLALHHSEEAVALECQRDLLGRRCDKVGVAGAERAVLTGNRKHPVDVFAEAERCDAELPNLEAGLGSRRRRAEDDRPDPGVAIPLAQWSSALE